MRIWLPIVLTILITSGLFSWLTVQLGQPSPMWAVVDETKRDAGQLQFAEKNAPGYTVGPLKSHAVIIDAGRRVINQEHAVELEVKNSGKGTVECHLTLATQCGCISPLLVDGKELEIPQAGETAKGSFAIDPGKTCTIKIRWKPTEKQLPDGPRKIFSINLHFDVRNDPQFKDELLTIQVECEPILPPMEGPPP